MNDLVLNMLRGAVTVTLFLLFLVLIVWAWSPRRKKEFTAAADLVFEPGDPRDDSKAKRDAPSAAAHREAR